MYHVYVLRSEKTGRRSVGSTQDIAARLLQHKSGQSLATKHGIPWKLIHQEGFPTRAEAVRRERFYNTGKGREVLDQLPE
ncbi:MAG: GIY-YIG nuclease family protein [Chthoniobacterales bacterium]